MRSLVRQADAAEEPFLIDDDPCDLAVTDCRPGIVHRRYLELQEAAIDVSETSANGQSSANRRRPHVFELDPGTDRRVAGWQHRRNRSYSGGLDPGEQARRPKHGHVAASHRNSGIGVGHDAYVRRGQVRLQAHARYPTGRDVLRPMRRAFGRWESRAMPPGARPGATALLPTLPPPPGRTSNANGLDRSLRRARHNGGKVILAVWSIDRHRGAEAGVCGQLGLAGLVGMSPPDPPTGGPPAGRLPVCKPPARPGS